MARLPNASQGPIAAGFGGCVGGPADASTAVGLAEADDINASGPAVDAGIVLGAGVAGFGTTGACVALVVGNDEGVPQIEANAMLPGAWFDPAA
jgi:hypothetical protein